MLEARDVTCRVGEKTLIHRISGKFEPGRLTLVIGANGAGKSTLIRALCGQVHLDQGNVLYDARPLEGWSDRELAKRRAVLSQNVDLAFPLRAREVVMMGRYPHFTSRPDPRDREACQEAMRFFDVMELAHRNYLTLSGGERQRVQFARVLTQIWHANPDGSRYLLLDEPLTFLDIRYQVEFMRKIRELLTARDLVVVGVVHDLNLAARFADHLLLLRGGEVIGSGHPNDVLTRGAILEAFGIAPVVQQRDNRLQLFFE